MKKTKIVIPALGIIAFATAASITGTVAWFTANSRVTIEGMTFKTTVSNNLFVSADTTEANFGESLTQAKKGILLPTSTVDGISYYYTVSAKADGSAVAGFTAYSNAAATGDDAASYADKFSQDYKLTTASAGGLITGETGGKAYLDYSFYLKANFVSDSTAYLYMSKCNLLYDASGTPAAITEKAWRVALFVADATSDGSPAACNTVSDADTAKLVTVSEDTNANLKTILAPSGAENQTVVSTKDQGINGTAANAKADVQKQDSSAIVFTSTAPQTKYFKLVVRLWLEGEDKTCTVDTFKLLTNDYKLDLAFETATTNTGAVAVIGSVA